MNELKTREGKTRNEKEKVKTERIIKGLKKIIQKESFNNV